MTNSSNFDISRSARSSLPLDSVSMVSLRQDREVPAVSAPL